MHYVSGTRNCETTVPRESQYQVVIMIYSGGVLVCSAATSICCWLLQGKPPRYLLSWASPWQCCRRSKKTCRMWRSSKWVGLLKRLRGGQGGGRARPSSSYKLPLFPSMIFSYQTCFVCPWHFLQSTWQILVLACNISAYMCKLYHVPQQKCMLSQVTMVALYCVTYIQYIH